MKTRLTVINLALLAGLGVAAWQLNIRLKKSDAEREANLNVPIRPVTAVNAAPAAKPEPAAPVQYAQVAEKNLFSSDRNPTVVIEPPKEEKVKPMPPLPVVYGVMGLPSGTKAIMAEKAGQQSRAIREGDTIGEFKVLALNPQNVKFEWEGKQIEKRIEDLVDRSNPQQGGGQASGPAAPPPSSAAAAPPPPTQNVPPSGATQNPDGTYSMTDKDGKRWIMTRTPFGLIRTPDNRGR